MIGIGAQRTGSSWLYACMYEHPQICMPRKEINFFSRERNWSRGFEWYEGIFAECPATAVCGEFSTSYLPDPETPLRIHDRYPDVRLIVSLRHPAERAYSSYLNDILAGVVSPKQSFREALERASGVRRRQQVRAPSEQLSRSVQPRSGAGLDVRRRRAGSRSPPFRQIYRFLGVDPGFRPTMLDRPVGIGRVPRSQGAERSMLELAEAFRHRRALRPVWWMAKKSGIGDRVRALNTRP